MFQMAHQLAKEVLADVFHKTHYSSATQIVGKIKETINSTVEGLSEQRLKEIFHDENIQKDDKKYLKDLVSIYAFQEFILRSSKMGCDVLKPLK